MMRRIITKRRRRNLRRIGLFWSLREVVLYDLRLSILSQLSQWTVPKTKETKMKMMKTKKRKRKRKRKRTQRRSMKKVNSMQWEEAPQDGSEAPLLAWVHSEVSTWE